MTDQQLTPEKEGLLRKFSLLPAESQRDFLKQNGIATEVTMRDGAARRKTLYKKAFRKYLEGVK